MNGLDKAIKHQGGLTSLAKSLDIKPNGKGVVYQWRARGNVPPEYCVEIEKLTGVPCEELNSKVDWSYLRNKKFKQTTKAPEPL